MGAQNTNNSLKKTYKNGFQKKSISGSSNVFRGEEARVREGLPLRVWQTHPPPSDESPPAHFSTPFPSNPFPSSSFPLGGVLDRLGGLLVANMAQTRPPKRGQNPIKNDIKIGPIFDTPWKGYILRSWWIWDTKMGTNGLPTFVKFRYQLPKGHFLFGGIIPDGF